MTTIGIIGANGQVGTETCLFLSAMPGVRPIAICRTELASSFLRRCGIECRHGRIDSDSGSALLESCDVVADFSLIKGPVHRMRETIKAMVTSALRFAPAGARYVYISSEMAYGMRQADMRFRRQRISRTSYGASKRFGERLATGLARQSHHEVYILRLGQVHGLLQAESLRIRRQMMAVPAVIPDAPSDTLFAFTVADALTAIAAGREEQGTYTLVSSPQWTWKELYEYYAAECGIEPQTILLPATEYMPKEPSVGRRMAVGVLNQALQFREALTSCLLYRNPDLEQRLAARFRTRRAAKEIAAMEPASYRPFNAMIGEVLGKRLRTLADSRVEMPGYLQEVRRRIASAAAVEDYHAAVEVN